MTVAFARDLDLQEERKGEGMPSLPADWHIVDELAPLRAAADTLLEKGSLCKEEISSLRDVRLFAFRDIDVQETHVESVSRIALLADYLSRAEGENPVKWKLLRALFLGQHHGVPFALCELERSGEVDSRIAKRIPALLEEEALSSSRGDRTRVACARGLLLLVESGECKEEALPEELRKELAQLRMPFKGLEERRTFWERLRGKGEEENSLVAKFLELDPANGDLEARAYDLIEKPDVLQDAFQELSRVLLDPAARWEARAGAYYKMLTLEDVLSKEAARDNDEVLVFLLSNPMLAESTAGLVDLYSRVHARGGVVLARIRAGLQSEYFAKEACEYLAIAAYCLPETSEWGRTLMEAVSNKEVSSAMVLEVIEEKFGEEGRARMQERISRYRPETSPKLKVLLKMRSTPVDGWGMLAPSDKRVFEDAVERIRSAYDGELPEEVVARIRRREFSLRAEITGESVDRKFAAFGASRGVGDKSRIFVRREYCVEELLKLFEADELEGFQNGIKLYDVEKSDAAVDALFESLGAERLEKVRLHDAIKILGKYYIGPESYKKIFGVKSVGSVPPIPAGVTVELLNSECPLANDGRKIKDTHRLVFIPSALDGKAFTIEELRYKARATWGRGTIFRDYYSYHDHEAFAKTPLSEGKWILMPTLLIPGTKGITYAAQEDILKKDFKDYDTPSALEMVAGLVMNDLCVRPARRKAGDYYDLYGWCSDELSGPLAGRRVLVGDLDESGLYVNDDDVDCVVDCLGRAARRNIE